MYLLLSLTCVALSMIFFFFNDTATTEIYTYGHTLSLHAALPIFWPPIRRDYNRVEAEPGGGPDARPAMHCRRPPDATHTSLGSSLAMIPFTAKVSFEPTSADAARRINGCCGCLTSTNVEP